MRDTTYDDACARPDTGTAETRHAVVKREGADPTGATAALPAIADPTHLYAIRMTLSTDRKLSVSAERDGAFGIGGTTAEAIAHCDEVRASRGNRFSASDFSVVGPRVDRALGTGAEEREDDGGSEHVDTFATDRTNGKARGTE
jgi:hypothetical protein